MIACEFCGTRHVDKTIHDDYGLYRVGPNAEDWQYKRYFCSPVCYYANDGRKIQFTWEDALRFYQVHDWPLALVQLEARKFKKLRHLHASTFLSQKKLLETLEDHLMEYIES